MKRRDDYGHGKMVYSVSAFGYELQHCQHFSLVLPLSLWSDPTLPNPSISGLSFLLLKHTSGCYVFHTFKPLKSTTLTHAYDTHNIALVNSAISSIWRWYDSEESNPSHYQLFYNLPLPSKIYVPNLSLSPRAFFLCLPLSRFVYFPMLRLFFCCIPAFHCRIKAGFLSINGLHHCYWIDIANSNVLHGFVFRNQVQ